MRTLRRLAPRPLARQPGTLPPRGAPDPLRQPRARAAACGGVDAGNVGHTLVVRPTGQADSRPLSSPTSRVGFEQGVGFSRQQVPGAQTATVLVGIEFAG